MGRIRVSPASVLAGSPSREKGHTSAFDKRQARIVEMKFFGGLSMEEIAGVLDISTKTANRDWTMARAWLHQEITR